jgi:hypothetical protein
LSNIGGGSANRTAAMQLTLRDQTNGRLGAQAMVVDWQASVQLTARTLITERVRIEWETQEAERAASGTDTLPPLVTLDAMRRLNPYQGSRRKPSATPNPMSPMTLESVTAVALEGFRRNAFFLIVDGRQMTELDEPIPFRTTSQVTFLRLIPLVGG